MSMIHTGYSYPFPNDHQQLCTKRDFKNSVVSSLRNISFCKSWDLFIPSKSEKEQRTCKKNQRMNGKHQRKFSLSQLFFAWSEHSFTSSYTPNECDLFFGSTRDKIQYWISEMPEF